MNEDQRQAFCPGTTRVAGGQMDGQDIVILSAWAGVGAGGGPPNAPPNIELVFIVPIAQAVGQYLIGEAAVIVRKHEESRGQNVGTAAGRLDETRGILQQMREALDNEKIELTGLLLRRALEVSEPRGA